jgi:hypothetical protein
MNNTNTYEERQSVPDIGEQLFEEWAKTNGHTINRIGFNSKDDNVPNFFKLSYMLRNLPDYVLNKGKKTYVVCVKGTANIKEWEVNNLDFASMYFGSSQAKLIYAFCFKGQDPVLMSVETLKERFNEAKTKKWHDGVKYRKIKI